METRLQEGLRSFVAGLTGGRELVVPPLKGLPAATQSSSTPPADRTVEAGGLIRAPLHCAAYGGFSYVVGAIHDGTFTIQSNERATAGAHAAKAETPPLSRYRIVVADSWPGCLLCGARFSRRYNRPFWVCGAPACLGLIHCAGEQRGGKVQHACGLLADNEAHTVYEFLDVRGAQAGGAAPSDAAPGKSVAAGAQEAVKLTPPLRIAGR